MNCQTKLVMDLEQLNFLPEWDENRFIKKMNRHGEAWKNGPGILAARDVYNHWRELFGLVVAFAENLGDENDENNDQNIHENEDAVAYAASNMVYIILLIYMYKYIND